LARASRAERQGADRRPGARVGQLAAGRAAGVAAADDDPAVGAHQHVRLARGRHGRERVGRVDRGPRGAGAVGLQRDPRGAGDLEGGRGGRQVVLNALAGRDLDPELDDLAVGDAGDGRGDGHASISLVVSTAAVMRPKLISVMVAPGMASGAMRVAHTVRASMASSAVPTVSRRTEAPRPGTGPTAIRSSGTSMRADRRRTEMSGTGSPGTAERMTARIAFSPVRSTSSRSVPGAAPPSTAARSAHHWAAGCSKAGCSVTATSAVFSTGGSGGTSMWRAARPGRSHQVPADHRATARASPQWTPGTIRSATRTAIRETPGAAYSTDAVRAWWLGTSRSEDPVSLPSAS